jgi:histone-lysine N-methyltransferase SETMAR
VLLALLELFDWELFDHPPYSPDIASSDYRLFTDLKNWLRLHRFGNNEELVEGFKMWLSLKAADIFDTGIQNLFPENHKCLSSGSDYVGK